ncbi:unnamed protein product [Moneuplotes crassus]|uniref:Uncharacterized protein n=1 Tax=Euplotes crassus TaxID=5936 RepID=A0AAD1XSD5_EUPCR|nr:unnamed protein product [Moneuplotes crassus]
MTPIEFFTFSKPLQLNCSSFSNCFFLTFLTQKCNEEAVIFLSVLSEVWMVDTEAFSSRMYSGNFFVKIE